IKTPAEGRVRRLVAVGKNRYFVEESFFKVFGFTMSSACLRSSSRPVRSSLWKFSKRFVESLGAFCIVKSLPDSFSPIPLFGVLNRGHLRRRAYPHIAHA